MLLTALMLLFIPVLRDMIQWVILVGGGGGSLDQMILEVFSNLYDSINHLPSQSTV